MQAFVLMIVCCCFLCFFVLWYKKIKKETMLSVLLTSCVVWLKFLEMRRFSSADLWSTKVSLLPLSFWVKRKRGSARTGSRTHSVCVCGVAVGESSSPCGGFCWCLRFLCGSRTRFATARRSDLPSRKIHVCFRVCVCFCVCVYVERFFRKASFFE